MISNEERIEACNRIISSPKISLFAKLQAKKIKESNEVLRKCT